MLHEKAHQIAHLIKAFGACMTASNTLDHIDKALDFNDLFDAYLKQFPGESAASIARHITRAISQTEALDQDLYERVLPDVLYVLGLSIKQDTGVPSQVELEEEPTKKVV